MGRIAAEGADVAVVTSDNPRTEDPGAIIDDIEQGMGGVPHRRIPDRLAAIHAALDEARVGDTLLLAGKGHETYQVVGTDRVPFDEREIVGGSERGVAGKKRERGQGTGNGKGERGTGTGNGERKSVKGEVEERGGGGIEWSDAAVRAALQLPGSRDRRLAFSGITTDSRTIAPGALFVALVGERFDGHDYLRRRRPRGRRVPSSGGARLPWPASSTTRWPTRCSRSAASPWRGAGGFPAP